MPPINFSSIAADSTQLGNPAGARRIARALAKSFTGGWPVKADITAGEITVAPRIAASSFAVYEVPVNTIDASDDQIGEPGYQNFKQSIEFQMAGLSKQLQAELAKDINAGSVFLVELNDDQWVVVGTSQKPIFMKSSGKIGKKGSDQRGKTLKGEEEGYLWGLMPLSSTVVTGLTFIAMP